MTTARFSISGSPSTDGGYDAAHDEVLSIALEDSPALDVRHVRVRVVTRVGPALVFTGEPSPVLSPVAITMPSAASGAVAYAIELQINGGVDDSGRARPEWTFTRIVVVRAANGLRMMLPGERTEYSPTDGWVSAFNEVVSWSLTAGGGGGVGDPWNTNGQDIVDAGAFSVAASTGLTLSTIAGAALLQAAGVTSDVTLSAGRHVVLTAGAQVQIAGGTYVDVQSPGIFLALNGGSVASIDMNSDDGGSIYLAGDGGISLVAALGLTLFGGVNGSVQLQAGSVRIVQDRLTIDAATGGLVMVAAQATSFATAVAANKVGGSLGFRVGDGHTPGTDSPGAFNIGLGVSVGTTSAGALVLGYGAAIGTPGSATYKPFTTELVSLSYVLDECKMRSPNKAIRISSVGNVVIEADAGQVALALAATYKFQATTTTTTIANNNITLNCGSGVLTQSVGMRSCTLATANARDALAWTAAGYSALKERRYFYGSTSSTATLFMAGAFVPPLANGLITITWKIKGSTASGATGYLRLQVDTYRIAAGVMTALSSTVLATHSNLASAPTVVASTLTVGNTTLGLAVAAGDAVATRWEGYAKVEYAAAA